MSVPTYNTLKRLTPAIVLVANKVFRLKPDPPRAVVITIIIVVLGCLVAGYGEGAARRGRRNQSTQQLLKASGGFNAFF